jgi:hypothetical protein
MTASAHLEQRLEEIRGRAPRRSPTVWALAAYAQHTDCRLATLGFAAGGNFDRLLVGTRLGMPFGQSPYAIARGLAFENLLGADHHAATLELLRGLLHLPASGARVANLREGYAAGPERMPRRARDTAAAGESGAPRAAPRMQRRAAINHRLQAPLHGRRQRAFSALPSAHDQPRRR